MALEHRQKRISLILCLGTIAATIVAYEPVRHNDFVDYDDDSYVTENPNVNKEITRESILWAFTTHHASNWHPLTWLSHMLDCQLFGLNPAGHHIVNLFFHIANTLLLFWILKRMTGAIWRSAFVATAFALHPLHVESVAWVAERKDVLSGLFWMLTMIAYVRYAERPNFKRYALMLLAFVMGLMSKPMLVTLPFVLLLLDYWPLGRIQWAHQGRREDLHQRKPASIDCPKSSFGRLVVEKIPLFALVVVSGVVTFISQQSAGAMGEGFFLSIRIPNAVVSYLGYIFKMIYPSRLAVLYPYPFDGLPAWQVIVSSVILAGMSAVVIYMGRRWRYLTVGWLWYLGTLVPVIGLVQVGSQAMADRYTYLPSIGIFIIVAWGAADLIAKWRYRRIGLGITASIILAVLLICTRIQVRYWQNSFTLYEHAFATTEKNFIIHNNYGTMLSKKGRLEEAIKHFNEALRLMPGYFEARNNLGAAFRTQGKNEEAIACFTEVLRIRPDQPVAYYNLGLAYLAMGKYEEAIQNYKEALRLKPDYLTARVSLAHTLLEMGQIQSAVEQYYKILQLKPDDLEVLNNLAWLLATVEDTKLQNPTDAVKYAQRACELAEPANQPAFLDTLAAAYAAAGNFPEAVKSAERAIELAEAAGKKDLVLEIQKRLELYKASRPYHER